MDERACKSEVDAAAEKLCALFEKSGHVVSMPDARDFVRSLAPAFMQVEQEIFDAALVERLARTAPQEPVKNGADNSAIVGPDAPDSPPVVEEKPAPGSDDAIVVEDDKPVP